MMEAREEALRSGGVGWAGNPWRRKGNAEKTEGYANVWV